MPNDSAQFSHEPTLRFHTMQHLLNAITAAVAQENWYGALSLSLALPDICGWLENPNAGSQDCYVAWFDQYLAAKYTGALPQPLGRHVFLSGKDCYALRCAFLHEGGEEILRQHAREALDRFQFTVAQGSNIVHCHQYRARLQLQVDIFCREFVQAGERWLREVGARQEVQARMPSLLRIYDVGGNLIG
jgi:hypothetical protein